MAEVVGGEFSAINHQQPAGCAPGATQTHKGPVLKTWSQPMSVLGGGASQREVRALEAGLPGVTGTLDAFCLFLLPECLEMSSFLCQACPV